MGRGDGNHGRRLTSADRSETAWQTGQGTTSALLDATGTRLAVKTGSTVSWLVFDLHGSVAALCSTAGSLTDAYRYDGFGVQIASSGSAANPWRYRGLLNIGADAWNGALLDMGARDYSPQLGAFTQRDSVQGAAANPMSMNRFLYALANPATLIDPDGHRACMEDDTGRCVASAELDKEVAKHQIASQQAAATQRRRSETVNRIACRRAGDCLPVEGSSSGVPTWRGPSLILGMTNPSVKEFRAIVRSIETKLTGRGSGKVTLSDQQQRELHDAITKQGLTYWEIVDVGEEMFEDLVEPQPEPGAAPDATSEFTSGSNTRTDGLNDPRGLFPTLQPVLPGRLGPPTPVYQPTPVEPDAFPVYDDGFGLGGPMIGPWVEPIPGFPEFGPFYFKFDIPFVWI
jgi:RHS repeat-associated protein